MNRIVLRWALACALMLAFAAVTLAEPSPAPRVLPNLLQNGDFTSSAAHWKIGNTNGKDKVKCNGVGYNSDCGFQFKGTSASEATTLKQAYKPTPVPGAEPVVFYGDAYARSVSGTSCLKFTVKVVFKNANHDPLKGTYSACGTGVAGNWTPTGDIGDNTSFGQNSVKKAIFSVKHIGVGVWMVDNFSLYMDDK